MRTSVVTTFLILATTAWAGSLAEQLVGHWRSTKDELVLDYVTNRDGTFTGYLAYKEKVIWKNAGKWSLEGKLSQPCCLVLRPTKFRLEQESEMSSWKSRAGLAVSSSKTGTCCDI